MHTRYLRYEIREAFYVVDLQRLLGFDDPEAVVNPIANWRGWCRRVAAALIAGQLRWFDVEEVFAKAWTVNGLRVEPHEVDESFKRDARKRAASFMRLRLSAERGPGCGE